MAVQYEVIGNANVHGFNPGERFHADLEPGHEARMLKGGYLRIVPARAPRKFSEEVSEEANEEMEED